MKLVVNAKRRETDKEGCREGPKYNETNESFSARTNSLTACKHFPRAYFLLRSRTMKEKRFDKNTKKFRIIIRDSLFPKESNLRTNEQLFL